MFFTLIASELDPASKTMIEYLREYKKFNEIENSCFLSSLYNNISIFISKNQLIFTDCFDDLCKKTDVFIFLSRHQSKSMIPSLTCHFPGNYFTSSNGGNHYGSKFNKLILDTDYGIGHIANKYNLINLNNDMLNQMISKCFEKVTHIIIDQKGLGNEKQRIMNLLKDIELEVIKI